MFNKILIVRTDRVGDVVLTTPAMAAIKRAWPGAHISVLVAPATRAIVEGNPGVDEVIVDDVRGEHRGLFGFWKLVGRIRRMQFDLAVVFHTKRRTNLLCALAGIRNRIGYANDKFGFLLTQKIPDDRPRGEKHEYQYCLHILESLGIREKSGELFFPLKEPDERWAQHFLEHNSLTHIKPLIAVHPDASCVSKRWPAEQFAEFIKRLTTQYPAQILIVGSAATRPIACKIQEICPRKLWDCTGQTTLGQLASLLKRCHLLISNDSGPVHVATAVKTPVISIFGRNQAGLSPTRWRPVGPKDSYLHKEVGCEVCLAHNCVINFECLRAVGPEDVLTKVDALFKL